MSYDPSKDPNSMFLISPEEFKARFDALYQIKLEQIRNHARAQRAAMLEDEAKRLKDTKPLVYWEKDDTGRFVAVVGGGGMWREDMRDKAKRLFEKPDPRTIDREKTDVKNDLDIAIDRAKKAQKGWKIFGG